MIVVGSIFIESVSKLHQHKIAAIQIGEEGIDIGIKVRPDGTTLCIIKESEKNKGASVTNSAEFIISFINERYLKPNGIDINRSVFIEIDSMNNFDFIELKINKENNLSVTWKPVKILNHVRNQEAVELLFGKDAKDLLQEMDVDLKNALKKMRPT